jgi:hypothetical protein
MTLTKVRKAFKRYSGETERDTKAIVKLTEEEIHKASLLSIYERMNFLKSPHGALRALIVQTANRVEKR